MPVHVPADGLLGKKEIHFLSREQSARNVLPSPRKLRGRRRDTLFQGQFLDRSGFQSLKHTTGVLNN